MNYKEYKAQARQKAIDWQLSQGSEPMSWGEAAMWANYFYTMGKRYGLLKEFKENGII